MPLDTYSFSKRYGWIQDKFGLSWQLNFEEETPQQNIIPSLMFSGEQAGRAEEAINFYSSIFGKSNIGMIARYGANQEPDKEGTIMYSDFMLEDQKFIAMDSAYVHDFKFNEAISLVVTCTNQAEIDYFWERLSDEPESGMCGWLKDKFGVSWQIIPKGMGEILNNPDKDQARKSMEAILNMKKIEIDKLQDL
jgi:predicted 3-demethylubiquinone-9 3-methyltransferase (glyoxalase superfamily)